MDVVNFPYKLCSYTYCVKNLVDLLDLIKVAFLSRRSGCYIGVYAGYPLYNGLGTPLCLPFGV